MGIDKNNESTRKIMNYENGSKELVYKDEVYAIMGAAFEVYKELGPGFLESVYQDALQTEAAARNIPILSQVKIPVYYKGKRLDKEFFADFIAYDKIIIELKVIIKLGNNEQAQLLNYLKATKMRLGLLLNFGSEKQLEWKRLIL